MRGNWTEITQHQWGAWLAESKVGERIVYGSGFTGSGRYHSTTVNYRSPALGRAWEAYMTGSVLLMQKRRGPFALDYIAQKRERH